MPAYDVVVQQPADATPVRPRGPVALARRLAGDERVRFLVVGGFNTALGYGLFVIFELAFGMYLVSLYGSAVIAIVVAFFLHRNVTYRVVGTGNVVIDFLRFVSVYVVSLAINTVALPLLVEFGRLNPLVAQALIVVGTTLISYFGHKLFSFRRRAVVD